MADTQRDKDEFVNASTGLFDDNTAGDISPQDLRDFVESMHLSSASGYISTASATTISVSSTWTKVAGTTTSSTLQRFTMPANNRFLYSGTPDVHVRGSIALTASAATGAKDFEFSAYHYDDSAASGAVITASIIGHHFDDTNKHALIVTFDAALETNDYIELHVQNITDTTNITVDYANYQMVGEFK